MEDGWEHVGRLDDLQDSQVEWTLTPKQYELCILVVSVILYF
jgi:hypothetical protein